MECPHDDRICPCVLWRRGDLFLAEAADLRRARNAGAGAGQHTDRAGSRTGNGEGVRQEGEDEAEFARRRGG